MSESRRERLRDIGLLILRLGVGGAYVWIHGWPKITGGPMAWEGVGEAVRYVGIDFGYPVWGFLAALAEFGGGLLFMLGLFFRPAALLLLAVMATAANMHLASGDGWRGAAHAGKMAFVFAGLVFIGPGRFSLDALLARRRRRTANQPVSPPESPAYHPDTP